MKIRTILSIIVIVLVAATLLVATNEAKQNLPSETIKIGIVTMTTGNLAFLGENIVNSAKLAQMQLGDRGKQIEFIIEDVGELGAQGASGTNAIQKLHAQGVSVVIDGMTSNGTMAAAPLLDQYRMVTITPLTGGQNVDQAAEYLFRNGPSDIIGGTKPAIDLYEMGYKNVALLTDNAEYTADIRTHFKNSYQGTIVSDQLITPDENDYRGALLKLAASKPDAIFLSSATGVSGRYIIKQARESGITVPIFTNFLTYGPDLITLAGTRADGIYVYDPEFAQDSEQVSTFMQQYEKAFGYPSPIPFHTTGTRDAIVMAVEAIESAGYDGEKIHDYLLTHIQNWQGYNGNVSFDSSGNSGNGFVLKQIRNGKLELVN